MTESLHRLNEVIEGLSAHEGLNLRRLRMLERVAAWLGRRATALHHRPEVCPCSECGVLREVLGVIQGEHE